MALFPQTKEDLRFAMSKAIARAPRPGYGEREHGDARLICVLGPKGGTGKTLTSCNLAVALALAGQKVLVIDLDLQFGDVALCMGIPPEKTMYDLAISGGSLDEDKLRDYVMTHDTGVDVLLAPARPDQASAITIELLRDVLDRRASAVRLRRRRHASGVHRRGDRDDRRELRPRHGRNARLALAQEHQARAGDARA